MSEHQLMPPRHPLALGGFLLSVAAFATIAVGLFAPFSALRFKVQEEPALNQQMVVGLMVVLPALLGAAAVWIGAKAMALIEASRGRYSGDASAVFSIMIGALTLVTGTMSVLALWYNH